MKRRRAPGCGEVRGDLGFLLIPGHDPERAGRLREHLAGCTACRAIFAEVRANFIALRKAPAPEPGPDFSREIMDRLPSRVPRRRRAIRLGLIPLVGVAGVLPWSASVGAGALPALAGPILHGVSNATARALIALLAWVGGAVAPGVDGTAALPGFSLGALVGLGLGGLALVGLTLALGAAVLIALALVLRRARSA